MLTNEQFERTRRLALHLTGIELHERHRELLYRRCCRSHMDAAGSLDALLNAAEASDPVAGRRVVNLVTTNYTSFFRHPWHFDIAAEHALWAAHRRGTARLWCAAAATGEEPYSLAIALHEVFGRENIPATILASDIDEEVLNVARCGEYGESALRAVSAARRDRYFRATGIPRRWRTTSALERLVEFRVLNLADGCWPVAGPLEVIFCRNVLMYLTARHRQTVLERMWSLLVPGGLLILDPAEHTGDAGRSFASRGSGLYQRVGALPKAASSPARRETVKFDTL